MQGADFVVVGGGIAGASVAYELAGRGRVVLLEMEQVCGYHTTGRSAALLTTAYERGVARLLTLASRAFLEAPPQGFVDTLILSPLPTLFVGDEHQRPQIERLTASARDKAAVEIVAGDTLASLCPVLRRDVLTVGAFEAGSMEIDVAVLHQGFLRGIRDRGGAIHTGAAVSQIEPGDDCWTIGTNELQFETPVVVDAAGAWADGVAEMAGVDPLGLQPMRRTAFVFDPAADTTSWPMVIEVDESFYFKPERSQVLGSLAEEIPVEPHDVKAEEIDVALAIDRIQAATTFDIRSVKRTWAGLRTFAPDRMPVNGFDGEAAGFYWLAGQGGFGIMTSPAMARAAAGLICDEELPEDLAAFGITSDALDPRRLVT